MCERLVKKKLCCGTITVLKYTIQKVTSVGQLKKIYDDDDAAKQSITVCNNKQLLFSC